MFDEAIVDVFASSIKIHGRAALRFLVSRAARRRAVGAPKRTGGFLAMTPLGKCYLRLQM
jgi:hypothetical protein